MLGFIYAAIPNDKKLSFIAKTLTVDTIEIY